jgi:hypothetical protein
MESAKKNITVSVQQCHSRRFGQGVPLVRECGLAKAKLKRPKSLPGFKGGDSSPLEKHQWLAKYAPGKNDTPLECLHKTIYVERVFKVRMGVSQRKSVQICVQKLRLSVKLPDSNGFCGCHFAPALDVEMSILCSQLS